MTKEKEKPDWGSSPYDDGYTHEAMHTTWVLMDTFERHVMEARTCSEFSDVADQAEKVHKALYDLYQLIGGKWTEKPAA